MGISILDLVLSCLRQRNFHADVAFPGQKFPRITEPAATVHIERVDRANLSVTVEVCILCPAAMGGTACELEALRATEALRWEGAVCIQNGCSYDGVAQLYMVPILATFTCIAEENRCTMGPGFSVYIDDVLQPDAVAFSEEEVTQCQVEYAMGEALPVGISPGSRGWTLRLEELIISGAPEPEEPQGAFTLTVERTLKTERYLGCRWTSVRREISREGLRRIRTGVAQGREEAESELSDL